MKLIRLILLLTISAIIAAAQTAAKPATTQKKPAAGAAQSPAKAVPEPLPPIGGMQQVAILEQRYKQAALGGDAAYVKKLLAPGYFGTSPDGVVSDRMQTVTAYETGAIKYESIELQEVKGRAYGTNVVVISARAAVKGKSNDRDISGTYQYTRVWMKQGSNWQVIAFQASPLTAANAPATADQSK